MDYLIQQFLSENNLKGVNGIDYFLRDDGKGAYISNWLLGIEQPSFTESEVLLANTKQAKMAVIKPKREIFQNAPFSFNGKEFKATRDAKLLFWSTVNGRTATQFPMDWRLSDDVTWISLSKEQAYELYDALEERDKSGYRQESDFIEMVDNAKTVEEIESIVIEFR